MAEAVVVGVRVRPFNDREKGLNATLCIDMQGPVTIITGPSGIPQNFAFDQSFWSHDDFIQEDNGYCSPCPGGRYADQRVVYETFGQRVLDNAWAGYHCCLFAYGQTGAGKSYSMVGYGTNKGIVPISCEEVFNRINANDDSSRSYEIQVSMVEIYNETVQDLFIPCDQRPKNGFQIRESKALGVYVDGIVKNAVDSYAAIEAAIEQGTSNRSIGATQMNATSSRAHTVITIEFTQKEMIGGVENVKVSNINLIDLAGSEKAGQKGATGDRLKEGSAINKSLSALGNVIEKLAEKSQGKGKKDAVIPYRDSKLTRLLQNALGGSSKTIMICALSPASSNYEETLSTLRYADRAKKIKNNACVNENPMEKLMRELREENERLKAMVGGGGDICDLGDIGDFSDEARTEQKERIEMLQSALAEMQKDFQSKVAEAKKRTEAGNRQTVRALGIGQPVIVNLNSEMQLTGKLRFEFPEGQSVIGGTLHFKGGGENSDVDDSFEVNMGGRSSSSESDDDSDDDDDRPTIMLSSSGVYSKHAKIQNDGRRCILMCFTEASGNQTWINGANFNDLLAQRRKAKEAKMPPPPPSPPPEPEPVEVWPEVQSMEQPPPEEPPRNHGGSRSSSAVPRRRTTAGSRRTGGGTGTASHASKASLASRKQTVISESPAVEEPAEAPAAEPQEAESPETEAEEPSPLEPLEAVEEEEAAEEEEDDWPDDAVVLRHCDRVVFGRAIFLYVEPRQGILEMLLMSKMYSYAKARKELPKGWKGKVGEGQKRTTRFQTMIRHAVTRGLEQAEAEGGIMGKTESLRSLGGRGFAAVVGMAKTLSSRSLGLTRSSSAPDDDDDDGGCSDDTASLTPSCLDTQMIEQLQEDIDRRHVEISELVRERDDAISSVQRSKKDVAMLRQQIEEEMSRQSLPVQQLTRVVMDSRAFFNEKVSALDEKFRQALAELDSTRHGVKLAAARLDEKSRGSSLESKMNALAPWGRASTRESM